VAVCGWFGRGCGFGHSRRLGGFGFGRRLRELGGVDKPGAYVEDPVDCLRQWRTS